MSSAATSALKLHQRMTGVPFQLNRVYLSQLMLEDSFHYLLFALVFMSNVPITSNVYFVIFKHVYFVMFKLINLNFKKLQLF